MLTPQRADQHPASQVCQFRHISNGLVHSPLPFIISKSQLQSHYRSAQRMQQSNNPPYHSAPLPRISLQHPCPAALPGWTAGTSHDAQLGTPLLVSPCDPTHQSSAHEPLLVRAASGAAPAPTRGQNPVQQAVHKNTTTSSSSTGCLLAWCRVAQGGNYWLICKLFHCGWHLQAKPALVGN